MQSAHSCVQMDAEVLKSLTGEHSHEMNYLCIPFTDKTTQRKIHFFFFYLWKCNK